MAGDVKLPPPPEADDELDELPPLDGDGDEADEGSEDEELDGDLDAEGRADALDDSTAEGDSALDEDIDTAGSESGWLDDAGESDALDVGIPDTFGDEEGATLLEGAEELDAEEEELGFSEGEAPIGDAGEEGFEEEEEEVREADLPPLDQDGTGEEGATDEPELLESLDEVDGDGDEPRPAWADRGWERAEGDVQGLAAVESLACDDAGSVVVGGQGLASIDANGVVTVLEALGLRGGAPRALAVDGALLVAVTPRAGVLVSDNGGASFVDANGWHALAGRDDAVTRVEVLGGEVWALLSSGALLWSRDRGATWARVEGAFDALAVDSSAKVVVAFGRGDGRGSVFGEARGGRVTAVPRPPLPMVARGALALAAHGARVGVVIPGRGAFLSTGAAGPWVRVEGTASATAVSFAEHGALVVALHSEAEARAWIALAYAGMEGDARTVAEIDPARPGESMEDGDTAQVRSLAWSAARGTLWAAGGFGAVALRPSRR